VRIAVLDTETTGDTELDQVVELAIVTLVPHAQGWKERSRWSTLIRPTVPIAPEARACHHLSDAELADKWTMQELLERRGLEDLLPEDEVLLVAHNAEFDYRLLKQSVGDSINVVARPWICTYQCAKHLWPEAPRYNNQVLRYWLGLDVPQLRSLPPHRALPDALVTAALVRRMLQTHSYHQLIALSHLPVLQEVCQLTKHRGEPWEQVPFGYLKWIVGCTDPPHKPDVLFTAQHWLAIRRGGRTP
jgi:exodeoxyribonuclease X